MTTLVTAMRLRSTFPWIILVFLISSLLVGMMLVLHVWQEIPIGDMVRDPTAVAGVSIYIGFLSQFGIFFWAGAATVCLFSAIVLRPGPGRYDTRFFLLMSGLLSLILGFDDVFLLHEAFFPHIGIPELFIFSCYGLFVFYYLLRFYRTILNTDFLLLGMALGFFALSVLLDLLDPQFLDPDLWEDGAKVVGIVSWLIYYLRTGFVAIRQGELVPTRALFTETERVNVQ